MLDTNDPTAHAEINVIRETSRKLQRYDLADCEIYTTCEPCPMCLGAIYWAKIRKLYFGCTRYDAAEIAFADKFIYDVIKGRRVKQQVKMIPIHRRQCLVLFREWELKADKIAY